MRLLYVTAEPWPTFRADVAALFGRYLPGFGVRSDLVTGRTPGNDWPAEWGAGKAILCDISGGQAKKHLKILLHGIRQLLVVDRNAYDAIQVRDMPVLGAVGLFAARVKRLSFFYWMSYPMSEAQIAYARERGLSRGLVKFLFPWIRGRVGHFLLYHLVLPAADHVFVQSERMKQDMLMHGVAAEKMSPVPMGVDFEFLRPELIVPAEDPRLTGRRILVYLGTLDMPRRIEVLFDMLARVRREIPEALLVLVGDTEDDHHRRWLKEQAEKLGVAEHVIWTGWLPMHEGWRYVRSAEVGLSPFPRGALLDSASPTKVLEYLALSVPVVCNDNPDQEKMITESGAGRCVPYKAEAFADAAKELLKMGNVERTKLGKKGRDYVALTRDYEKLASLVSCVYNWHIKTVDSVFETNRRRQ